MLELVPDNDEFQEDFSRHEESKAASARWLLRELEMQAWEDANPGKAAQHAPISDPKKVNLEHILPKNPGKHWKPILESDKHIVRECVNRLGNLCLLDKPSNKAQGAQSFAEKSEIYAKSDFILTKALSEISDGWNRAVIERRQKRLGEIAARRWPR